MSNQIEITIKPQHAASGIISATEYSLIQAARDAGLTNPHGGSDDLSAEEGTFIIEKIQRFKGEEPYDISHHDYDPEFDPNHSWLFQDHLDIKVGKMTHAIVTLKRVD